MLTVARPPYLLRKLYPKCVWRMPANEKKIYLTFDDGPVPEVSNWVLDILKQQQIKATFFCVGENVKNNNTNIRSSATGTAIDKRALAAWRF